MSDSITNTANMANRIEVSAIVQEACAQSSQRDGAENTMWQSAWSMVASINSRFASVPSAPDPAMLDMDMHDLWHMYWHGAVNTEPDSPKLDRLALHVIQAREQGVLARISKTSDSKGQGSQGGAGDETTTEGERLQAVTSDGGRIWTDLPFLVRDMTAHWTNDCAAMSSSQRLSGAQFLALLAAAGAAADDALCGIALVLLREALETPRPLGHLAPTGRDSRRQMRDLSVAELLPAANAWLFTAGRKLVQLSDAERNQFPVEVGRLGELLLSSPPPDAASSGGVLWELPQHGGFSPQRWTWWLRRLGEIASLAARDDHANEVGEGGRSLTSLVEGMMDNVLLIAAQTNGPVGQASQRSGGLVTHRPPMRLLGPDRPAAAGTGN
ncbi:hypothetical protein VTI74DRAFT_1125 [Chaetomium olivicolor]